jgi:2-oxoisovalerate dehydrogenase E1 component alpha subunit
VTGPSELGTAETEAPLEPRQLLGLYDVMLQARCLDERMLRLHKQGLGAVWIGGPGEEALGASLGLLAYKGQGPLYDYLHLHYRSGATLLAMGADPADSLRQMMSTATDPYSSGRNLCHHYSVRRYNVVPVSSPIEVQFSMAPGTALANKRAGGRGITIVQGGDAGTAEGDFATCMIWCSRPKNELPCLMVVANNGWGISTPFAEQHGERRVADRAAAFGIESAVIDGHDAEVVYRELGKAMNYVRVERRPFVLEVGVSRLYGHSSSSGGNFVSGEPDCLALLERTLIARRIVTQRDVDDRRRRAVRDLLDAAARVGLEPAPKGRDADRHVYADRDLVGADLSCERPAAREGGET